MAEKIVVLTCDNCGKRFERSAARWRYRLKVSPDTGAFCSRSCNARHNAEGNLSEWRGDHAQVTYTRNCAACGKRFSRTSKAGEVPACCSLECAGRNAQALRWEDHDKRFGDNVVVGPRSSHPNAPGHCRDWTGASNGEPMPHGYFQHDGTSECAHRYALARHLGRPIRDGFVVHHKCFRPQCVNPEHLVEMTPSAHVTLHKRRAKLAR